jgi:hypothetical protein
MLNLKDATIEDASLLADIYFKAEELYKTKKVIPWTEAILEILRASAAETPVKKVVETPTNWKEVKAGTPVLFRRSNEHKYEAGAWVKCVLLTNRKACSGSFFWDVTDGEGEPFGLISDLISNGELHIDPFWCKLAEKD